MSILKSAALPCLLITFTAGCASLQPREAMPDVSHSVQQRIDQQIFSLNSGNPDPAIAAATVDLSDRELTAGSAVQLALFNNRNLQASIEDLGISQAELVQAGLLSNPVFSALVRFPDGKKGGADVELSITQNFLELLSLPLRKRIAATEHDATKARVAGEVITLATDVRAAFFNAVAANDILEVRKEMRAISDANNTAIAELHRAGNVTALDLSTRTAMNAQATLDVSVAQAAAVTARERLLLLLDLPESLSTTIQLPQQTIKSPTDAFNENDLQSLAVRQRLDLAEQMSEANALAQTAGISQRFSWLNDAQLTVDGEHEVEGYWITGPGLNVPIPIFDTGAAKTAIAHGKLQQAASRLKFAAARVRSEVRIAFAEMSASQERVDYIDQTLVPLRESIAHETLMHYNAMSASVFDLLDARREALCTRIESIEAHRDYWESRVELERAIGGSLTKFNRTADPVTSTRPS